MSQPERNRSARQDLVQARRIVIKVGSGVLVNGENQLDEERIGGLTQSLAGLMEQKKQVLLVSSGAVAAGAPVMNLERRARTIPQKQACAAVGQSRLMALYERLMAGHQQHTAQVLLTQDDVRNRERYLNAKNTLETLLSAGILPIVNENDTVVVEEIKFGDNDNLSAQVAALVQADLLLMLSSVEGFYDQGMESPQAEKRRIPVVDRITDAHYCGAKDHLSPEQISTGGMKSKLLAIQKAVHYGIPSVLASGLRPGVIERVLAGEDEGTLFLPEEEQLSARKHWILHSLKPQGELQVDDGAAEAIVQKGRSLLPIGIVAVKGDFRSGNAVRIVNPVGVEIARGLTHYSSSEVALIQGCRSGEIETRLGYSYYHEVIHRDDLVLLK